MRAQHDCLLIHRRYGIIIISVKAVGDNFREWASSGNEQWTVCVLPELSGSAGVGYHSGESIQDVFQNRQGRLGLGTAQVTVLKMSEQWTVSMLSESSGSAGVGYRSGDCSKCLNSGRYLCLEHNLLHDLQQKFSD